MTHQLIKFTTFDGKNGEEHAYRIKEDGVSPSDVDDVECLMIKDHNE
jgi:hypothetical protein